ncbi:hypothetical protein GCM10026983_25120 [Gracilibacillus alcaliphilus]
MRNNSTIIPMAASSVNEFANLLPSRRISILAFRKSPPINATMANGIKINKASKGKAIKELKYVLFVSKAYTKQNNRKDTIKILNRKPLTNFLGSLQ